MFGYEIVPIVSEQAIQSIYGTSTTLTIQSPYTTRTYGFSVQISGTRSPFWFRQGLFLIGYQVHPTTQLKNYAEDIRLSGQMDYKCSHSRFFLVSQVAAILGNRKQLTLNPKP